MSAVFAKSDQLTGRRVILRPLVPDDFDAWSQVRVNCGEWLTKWEPSSVVGVPHPQDSRLAFSARCAARERERQNGAGYGFGIFDGSRFVGEVNLNNIVRGAYKNAFVGYWVDRAVAGQGYMPESLVVAFRYAFEDLGLHRVQISVIPRNTSSRRVLEKLKLRDEGMALRYLEINGVWEDHVRYAITVEEWEDRRGELLDEWVN